MLMGGVGFLSKEQAELIRDSLYLVQTLIYGDTKNKPIILNPYPDTISEEILKSTLDCITMERSES